MEALALFASITQAHGSARLAASIALGPFGLRCQDGGRVPCGVVVC
jgi:hypothetical protein